MVSTFHKQKWVVGIIKPHPVKDFILCGRGVLFLKKGERERERERDREREGEKERKRRSKIPTPEPSQSQKYPSVIFFSLNYHSE